MHVHWIHLHQISHTSNFTYIELPIDRTWCPFPKGVSLIVHLRRLGKTHGFFNLHLNSIYNLQFDVGAFPVHAFDALRGIFKVWFSLSANLISPIRIRYGLWIQTCWIWLVFKSNVLKNYSPKLKVIHYLVQKCSTAFYNSKPLNNFRNLV